MGHTATAVTPPKPDAVVLEILRDSAGEANFKINQQAISWAELPARLGDLYARRARRVLFVKGDGQLSFTRIAEVIDVSHAAGVDRVCLMTPKAVDLWQTGVNIRH
jgi:biopolymer transport protein ExbD